MINPGCPARIADAPEQGRCCGNFSPLQARRSSAAPVAPSSRCCPSAPRHGTRARGRSAPSGDAPCRSPAIREPLPEREQDEHDQDVERDFAEPCGGTAQTVQKIGVSWAGPLPLGRLGRTSQPLTTIQRGMISSSQWASARSSPATPNHLWRRYRSRPLSAASICTGSCRQHHARRHEADGENAGEVEESADRPETARQGPGAQAEQP